LDKNPPAKLEGFLTTESGEQWEKAGEMREMRGIKTAMNE
jgi:hypothetical protein